MNNIFEWLTVISAVLITLLVLIQTRGASLGAGLGGGSEIHTVRRGSDRSLHQLTIICVIVFIISLVLSLTGS
jgi:protein translocase SecG subunit